MEPKPTQNSEPPLLACPADVNTEGPWVRPSSSISAQSFSFTNISYLFVATLPLASKCDTSEALILPSLSPLNFKMGAGMALPSEAYSQDLLSRLTLKEIHTPSTLLMALLSTHES